MKKLKQRRTIQYKTMKIVIVVVVVVIIIIIIVVVVVADYTARCLHVKCGKE